jgi:hypothetical protein
MMHTKRVLSLFLLLVATTFVMVPAAAIAQGKGGAHKPGNGPSSGKGKRAQKKADKADRKAGKADKRADKLNKRADKAAEKAKDGGKRAEKRADKLEKRAEKAEERAEKKDDRAEKAQERADKIKENRNDGKGVEKRAERLEKKLAKEQTKHTRRVKRIDEIEAIAKKKGNDKLLVRIKKLRDNEARRHQKRLAKIKAHAERDAAKAGAGDAPAAPTPAVEPADPEKL